MANLSTILGAGGDASFSVYDPLPTFGVWSNYGNNPNYSVHDGFGGQVTAGYANTDAELYSNYTGGNYTNNTVSSNAWSSTGTIGMTVFNQAEGHYCLNLPGNGNYYDTVFSNPDSKGSHWNRFGTIINPVGIRAKTSLYVFNGNVRMYSFGSNTPYESFTWTSSTYSDTSGSPGNNTYGMLVYNKRIDTLVIVTNGGSSSHRAHIWKNPNVDLSASNYAGSSIARFMRDARDGLNGASYVYNDFTWSYGLDTGSSESLYHGKLVLGDTGELFLARQWPNNGLYAAKIALNTALSTSIGSVTNLTNVSTTTSYGWEQGGNYYGTKRNITWNNKWVAIYVPYYYYGSGMCAFFVNTENPSIYYTWQYSDSSSGVGIAPSGESGFIFGVGQNADGDSGMYTLYANLDNIKDRVGVGNSITANGWAQWIDTYYTSTNYPLLASMSTWLKGVPKG